MIEVTLSRKNIMFKTEDIIGDIIFISFTDKSTLQHVGIDIEFGHFKVKGYDHLGLWVEHPNLFNLISEDSNGKPLPPGKEKKEYIEANIFVHWSNIKTLMHYPNRQGFDFPSEFDKDIGFKIKASEILDILINCTVGNIDSPYLSLSLYR